MATPLGLSVAAPRDVELSKNVTVPEGSGPLFEPVTVAVNATCGLPPVVVVAAITIVVGIAVMDSLTLAEVLVAS